MFHAIHKHVLVQIKEGFLQYEFNQELFEEIRRGT
jgi:hypothetical protein